ncbi:pseudouridine synthase [Plectosphaerella plurivora]|uniref:Pseudouridine synthase n=1 Tax=Plectosphaerella plurivora TaxID=936078 RepID=A0A9P8VFR1_9PEZI|nr:pseudouridine synthase [Plectosphaerella plurivora]
MVSPTVAAPEPLPQEATQTPTLATDHHVPRRRNPKKEKPLPDVLITPSGDLWPRPYYFEDGLRKVKPYHWTYQTFVKERWRDRTLLDVFTSEFRDRPIEYYRKAMLEGKINISQTPVGPDYIVKNGDCINNTMHRHEPPVNGCELQIIHEDDEILVLNKPSGIPVHPAGRYNFNSITQILMSDRGAHFIARPCHRLDRLTSGILFFGKTAKGAVKMSEQIRARTVRKEYVARVHGRFPDGDVVCEQPILQISPRLGLNRVRANGKPALSVFKRLAYYGPEEEEAQDRPKTPEQKEVDDKMPWKAKKGYSIVRCLPVTGRTHQLRVHLQHLGHPIANDPIYANQRVWGFDLGSNDAEGDKYKDEDIMARLERMGKEDVADAVAYHDEQVEVYQKRRAEHYAGFNCEICDTPMYTDPGEEELSLWLHSLRYEDSGGAWSFTSPLPDWALPPDGVSGPTQVGEIKELVNAVEADKLEAASQ